MILEFLAIFSLVQFANIILRLIGRRNDVLSYVSRSGPHR
jgi:hypothetical protein